MKFISGFIFIIGLSLAGAEAETLVKQVYVSGLGMALILIGFMGLGAKK